MRNDSSRPRRSTTSVTSLPPGPCMRATASSNSSAEMSTPSTRLMTSPGSMPARAAGEPSMGEMITNRFLRFSTSMPMPSICSLPSVSCFRRPYSSGSMKRECGIEHVGEAARGAVHEIGLGDVLDVVPLDVREHLREHAQLLVRVEAAGLSGGRRPARRKAASTSNDPPARRQAAVHRREQQFNRRVSRIDGKSGRLDTRRPRASQKRRGHTEP